MRDFTIVVCFEDATRRRFLMVRNQRRGWELPGGGLEPDEGPVEGARREFEEETQHALDDARLLLTQARAHGTGHVVVGTLGASVGSRHPDEAVVEVRFVERLRDVAPLAFPNDPYEEIERALGRPIR